MQLRWINRRQNDFKKYSTARKQTEEYFNTRLENINAIWKSFDKTYSQIRELPQLNMNDEYFTFQLLRGYKGAIRRIQWDLKART